LIEQAHVPQVRDIEASSELGKRDLRPELIAIGTVVGPRGPALFEFDDMPPDLPARLYLDRIDNPHHALTSLLDEATKVAEQEGGTLVICLLYMRFHGPSHPGESLLHVLR